MFVGILSMSLIAACLVGAYAFGDLVFTGDEYGLWPTSFLIPFGACFIGVGLAYGNLTLNVRSSHWRDEYFEDALFRLARAFVTLFVLWWAFAWLVSGMVDFNINLTGFGALPNLTGFALGLGVFGLSDTFGVVRRGITRIGRARIGSADSEVAGPESTPTEGPEPTRSSTPVPQPPEGLVQACANDECVVFVGPGASAAAGFPNWKDFLLDQLEWAAEHGALESDGRAASMRRLLSSGDLETVADALAHAIESADKSTEYDEHVAAMIGRGAARPTRLHRALRRVPFEAALTTNFDFLLEDTYGDVPVFSYHGGQEVLTAITQRAFFILKLRGGPDVAPILAAPAQFRSTVSSDLVFADALERIFAARRLLFIGSTVREIDQYLRAGALQKVAYGSGSPRRHFALVPDDEEGWEVVADVLARRYGIEFLPYSPSDGHPELTEFLTNLGSAVESKNRRGQDGIWTPAHPSALHRLELTNIGAFESLSIDLDTGLNVLLGDNGVGKSTILKAIAFAVSGRPSDETARALLRSGATSGRIRLDTCGGSAYSAEIKVRSDGSYDCRFVPLSWMEGEGKLALGFPPLRVVTSARTRGADVLEASPRPHPSDVLPLTSLEADPRIVGLKQWLVNLDYLRRREKDPQGVQRLLDDFFESLDKLIEGVKVDFRDLIVEDKEIAVETDDGVVPLHLLSQGTVSLIGWVGVLLQRLFEVHGDEPSPRDQFAIVLMDEVDAHMHPSWQQSLIDRVRDCFPNVQFFFTTHSPFVVAGREAGQIKRLRRGSESEGRRIVVEDAYADTKGDGIASILTSYLFGLEAQTDNQTKKLIVRRRSLLRKQERSESDRTELQEINERLGGVFLDHTRDPDRDEQRRQQASDRRGRGSTAVSEPMSYDEAEAFIDRIAGRADG